MHGFIFGPSCDKKIRISSMKYEHLFISPCCSGNVSRNQHLLYCIVIGSLKESQVRKSKDPAWKNKCGHGMDIWLSNVQGAITVYILFWFGEFVSSHFPCCWSHPWCVVIESH
jgi:hypothetical protein